MGLKFKSLEDVSWVAFAASAGASLLQAAGVFDLSFDRSIRDDHPCEPILGQ